MISFFFFFFLCFSFARMKGTKLQATFARRRDLDQIKIEKSAKVNNYFDKWDRITTRYEQWTTPEYYKLADENWKSNQEKQSKENLLDKRREKLQKLFEDEKFAFEAEINGKSVLSGNKL